MGFLSFISISLCYGQGEDPFLQMDLLRLKTALKILSLTAPSEKIQHGISLLLRLETEEPGRFNSSIPLCTRKQAFI